MLSKTHFRCEKFINEACFEHTGEIFKALSEIKKDREIILNAIITNDMETALNHLSEDLENQANRTLVRYCYQYMQFHKIQLENMHLIIQKFMTEKWVGGFLLLIHFVKDLDKLKELQKKDCKVRNIARSIQYHIRCKEERLKKQQERAERNLQKDCQN